MLCMWIRVEPSRSNRFTAKAPRRRSSGSTWVFGHAESRGARHAGVDLLQRAGVLQVSLRRELHQPEQPVEAVELLEPSANTPGRRGSLNGDNGRPAARNSGAYSKWIRRSVSSRCPTVRGPEGSSSHTSARVTTSSAGRAPAALPGLDLRQRCRRARREQRGEVVQRVQRLRDQQQPRQGDLRPAFEGLHRLLGDPGAIRQLTARPAPLQAEPANPLRQPPGHELRGLYNGYYKARNRVL